MASGFVKIDGTMTELSGASSAGSARAGCVRLAQDVDDRRAVGPSCNMPVMSWLAWLVLAALITAAAAVTGIKPKGTRHVAHTRMMGMARLALLVLVVIFAYLVFRARSGG